MPETDIADLVRNLNSLEEGDKTVAKLILAGPAAIEPLEQFLFKGKPSVVYQPRRWAIEALAGLGAKDVLIEYLNWAKNIRDPAVRLAEEAVENAAAQALAAWRTEDVFEALLSLVSSHPRVGLVEALAEFERAEPIPYFVAALEDDICRAAAEQALHRLGKRAAEQLIRASLTRVPSAGDETPSSLLRRVSALNLLGELELEPACWTKLRPLLNESNSEIVIAASNIAAPCGSPDDKIAAIRRLLEILPSTPWFAHEEIETALIKLHPAGAELIESETARLNSLPYGERVMNRALPTLLRVQRKVSATCR